MPFNNYDIYLPLNYNNGQLIESEKFKITKDELISRFGGLSTIPGGSAFIEGWWKRGDIIMKDRIVIYRVQVAGEYDDPFWPAYKEILKQRFNQQEILIQIHPVNNV
ncbi:MAG: hypothetical protein JSV30_03015 [Candidatus Omnitrophota bacterium]|nr:MAG: hypothetical protein JSV30_03015 [Candidatus Omnitrophota bacterium]